MSVIKMTDLDLAGKRVLIRADLNVPVKDGKVASDKRITATMPTIKYALEHGAKVMVTSHLGRPTEGEYDEAFSLKPVVDYLQNKLDVPVRLVKDYLVPFGIKLVAAIVVGAVLLIVNNNKQEKYLEQMKSASQYLQSGELELLGLQTFDSWVGMFAEKTTEFEIAVDTNSYRLATRF